VLPQQQLTRAPGGAVVRIELVEARLDQLRILGARSTNPDFFRARLHARPGALLRLPQLRRDLILINTGNDLQARALLQPGRSFGTTDLVVQVQEPAAVSLVPSFDDVGRSNIGLRRLGLALRDDSAFGERDTFTAGASWATGTLSTTAAYSFPLTVGGTRLSLAADYAGIRILNGQLKNLGVRGHSTDFSLGLSQPLVVRPGFVFHQTAAFDVMQSITSSNGFGISNQTVFAGEFGGDLQWFDSQGVWIASDTVAMGGVNLGGPHSFARDSAALTREENLGGEYTGLIRFSGQTRLFAPKGGLPLVEQLQVGGLSTVRGYPEGWEIADTGYAITNEMDYPLPLRQYFFGGAFSRGLKGAVFADHGGVFGLAGKQRRLYLTSIGAGVIFSTPWLGGRLDWAAPLENRAGLPKVGFDFYLQPRIGLGWLGRSREQSRPRTRTPRRRR
ncbi:MAG: ShlB/FhaC/HecB family hemolysin secretion/activation protein, partial [Terriglobales bacterium]